MAIKSSKTMVPGGWGRPAGSAPGGRWRYAAASGEAVQLGARRPGAGLERSWECAGSARCERKSGWRAVLQTGWKGIILLLTILGADSNLDPAFPGEILPGSGSRILMLRISLGWNLKKAKSPLILHLFPLSTVKSCVFFTWMRIFSQKSHPFLKGPTQ